MARLPYPRSLPEFQELFPDEAACLRYLFALRWPQGWSCEAGCGGAQFILYDTTRSVFCRQCRKKTSLTAATIMHRSKHPLLSWFYAAYLMCTLTPGISAVQLQSQLGLRRNETAFQMLHKLRSAMLNPEREPLHGRVEVDETFIGGRTRKGAQMGRGTRHKALVVGAVEIRESKAGRKHAGRVRLRVITKADRPTLRAFVRESIAEGTLVCPMGGRATTLRDFATSTTQSRTAMPAVPVSLCRTSIESSPISRLGSAGRIRGVCSAITSRPTSTNSPFATTAGSGSSPRSSDYSNSH